MEDFDLKLKKKSLSLLGCKYDNLDDKTKEDIDLRYEDIINKSLMKYRWNFAKRTSKLLNKTSLEDNKYKYSYDLPTDFLVLINAFEDIKETSFIEDYETTDKFYCNSKDVYLKYIKRIPTELFTVYFYEYVIYELACELCYNLTGDVKLLEYLEKMRQYRYENAINIDSRQRPPRRQLRNPFNDER